MDAVDQQYVEQLEREYVAGINDLWSENTDFAARLGQAKVAAVYDTDDDLMEITLDGPQEAVSYSIHNTLYLRADFETRKIVGIELEHFRSHAAENSIEFRFCWGVLQLAGTTQLTVRAPATGECAAMLDKIVHDLVTAR